MDLHQKNYREKIATVLIKNLNKRRMAASYAPTSRQARDEILAMIPPGSTVSRTGSMSLVEMGLWEELAKNSTLKIIDPYAPNLAPETSSDLRRQGLLADIMITSSNALTLDGKIVNLDGLGNRVAAMCFGPEKGYPGYRHEQSGPGPGFGHRQGQTFGRSHQCHPLEPRHPLRGNRPLRRLQKPGTHLQYVVNYRRPPSRRPNSR